MWSMSQKSQTRFQMMSSTDSLQLRSARTSVSAALLWAAMSTIAPADTLHDIGGGTYQHHDSSWTFPNRVAEFTRIGAPQDVDGTVDVVAHYARTTESVRTTAVVDIYPKDSAAAQARYADALTALRSESPAETAQIKQTIHIEGSLPLTAVKTFYKAASEDGTKPQSSLGHSVLYFIDTGYWIVKIRTRIARLEAADLAASDAFVLHQPWESLGLTKESCTGPACAASQTSAP
jgi:hypothetical protein